MRKPRPVNFDNLDLIGRHYRLPGSIVPCVVDDVSETEEGTVRAVNTLNCKPFDVPAATVRWAIEQREKRASQTAPAAKATSHPKPALETAAGDLLEVP